MTNLNIGKDATVGIIGLGIMGSSFASNLLTKGYNVHVFNRTKDKAKSLIEKGAIFHDTPRALASVSDVILTSLTDHYAVESVAFGDDGFLAGLRKGRLWIDLSTIDPAASVRHAQAAKGAGILRLDTPVVGSKEAALKGEIVVLVGGSDDVYRDADSFLKDIGKTVIYLGGDGNGHKMKITINLYLALVTESFSESLTLARKLGLDGKTFVDTVNQTGHKSFFSLEKGPKIVAQDFEPAFALSNLFKDLNLVKEQIHRTGAVLPLTETAIKEYSEMINKDNAQKDSSIIALEIQRRNGLDLKS